VLDPYAKRSESEAERLMRATALAQVPVLTPSNLLSLARGA
jgi:hypothetical protein